MASDDKVLVQINPPAAAWLLAKHGIEAEEGSWLQVTGLEAAPKLALKWKTPLVRWSIQTTAEVLMMSATVGGKDVRDLTYIGEEGTWDTRGKPQPFEDVPALAKWLKRKRLSVSPDGYDVLVAFLGASWDESTELAHAEVEAYEPYEIEPDEEDLLRDAVSEGKWPKVNKLLRKKQLRRAGSELLGDAAGRDDLSAAKKLIAAGADPNLPDRRSPLHRAKSKGMVKLLIKAGAKTENVDEGGQTPLVGAVTNVNPNTPEYVGALLAAGANGAVRFKGASLVSLMKRHVAGKKYAKPWASELEPLLQKALGQ